ncbi:cytidine diphosphate-diacylglycerol synthase, putative [Plasmodium gallinaceum]|uniref:Phosphatidate cytidylyltransferase n=1 Tax=Plasmodium gallinaceum TaxID=5849 RepID=A0A1J1GT14_PLAGA|nr:cytidine diphosphate-diacylglycerol synthase, putative [Plasmodium gallinaceum]CRG95618.1 cytidine diphosphate-diacylglycerol synthase, putative [Plasmodium gallinaceum]
MQTKNEKNMKNKYKNDLNENNADINYNENNKNKYLDVEKKNMNNIKRKSKSVDEQYLKNEYLDLENRNISSIHRRSKYIDEENFKNECKNNERKSSCIYKKKKSLDEQNFKNDLLEDENKNNLKSEYKKRKSSKDIKYYKELKHLKELVNCKENNKLSNIIKLYGYNKGNSINKFKSGINSTINDTLLNSENFESKIRTFKIRALWTFILISLYFLILAAGHFYCSLLVLILVTIVYREIISLKSIENKDKRLPQIFYIRWYWFFLTIITLGIPWIIPKLKHQIWFFNYLLAYHSIIMFILAFIGFAWFILSLRKYSLKYQFSQIGIILLSSLFIVTQSLMHIANIYSGMIWFIVPVSSVIVNDIFAYVFGILFGKTRLIELSPKKTVEGYVGSSIITILWGIFITYILQRYKFFICPQAYISFMPFSTWNTIDCEENSIFQQNVYTLPKHVSSVLFINKIYYTKMIFHGLVLSLFAAFLAPFGGFFASGFKRALKIKDFGQYIPGHGGVTDRFDCQIFVGMFTYIYMKTFVKKKNKINSYDFLIESIQRLDNKDILRLFNQLKTILDNKEMLKNNTNNKKKDDFILKDDKCLDDKCVDDKCVDDKCLDDNYVEL